MLSNFLNPVAIEEYKLKLLLGLVIVAVGIFVWYSWHAKNEEIKQDQTIIATQGVVNKELTSTVQHNEQDNADNDALQHNLSDQATILANKVSVINQNLTKSQALLDAKYKALPDNPQTSAAHAQEQAILSSSALWQAYCVATPSDVRCNGVKQ